MNWLKRLFKKQEPGLSKNEQVYKAMKGTRCGFAIFQEDDNYIFTYHSETDAEIDLAELLFVLLNGYLAIDIIQGLINVHEERTGESIDFDKVLSKYKDMAEIGIQNEANKIEEEPLVNPMMIFGDEE